jgi:hypothetical protein
VAAGRHNPSDQPPQTTGVRELQRTSVLVVDAESRRAQLGGLLTCVAAPGDEAEYARERQLGRTATPTHIWVWGRRAKMRHRRCAPAPTSSFALPRQECDATTNQRRPGSGLCGKLTALRRDGGLMAEALPEAGALPPQEVSSELGGHGNPC